MDEDYKKALKHSGKAFLAYPSIKQTKRKIERRAYNALPINKTAVAIIGSIAVSATQGKVSTKAIKNLKINTLGGSVKPKLEWDFYDKNTIGSVDMNWSF